ncbi:MAG: mercury(II) reductase, partial [bacterium]
MAIFKRGKKKRTRDNSGGKVIELQITGMTCSSCASHVQQALQEVDEVIEAHVPAWQENKAQVKVHGDVREETLTKAVKEAGYGASVIHGTVDMAANAHNSWQRDVDYDLVVIGTGGGGMGAAIRAAENGHKVAIVEGGVIGGTCVNIGCVPSKALIRAAEAYHTAGYHPFAGLKTKAEGVDWQALIEQKDELVTGLRQNKYVDVLNSYEDITLIQGWAKVDENSDVFVNDKRVLKAGRVVVATGASPKVLPIEGIENVDVLNSTTAMALQKQPQSLIVLGGRAIALELGQAFARLGTKVTILQRSPRLVPDHEPEIGETLVEYLRKEGIEVQTEVSVQAFREEKGNKIITASVRGERREFQAEQILMALGRTPNTRDMGLEAAGIELDKSGFIKVDSYLQTSNPKVYAVGDVTTLPNFVYVAAAAGGIAAENALNGNSKKFDLSVLPEVIFTDPQIATVGPTEAQAKAEGYDVKISTLPLEYVPRALAARDTRGFIKLVADSKSNRLLGAHILAAEAGEVIQTASLAVKMGKQHGFTVADLRDMLFPYLTQVEGIKLAAQTFEKDVAQLS